MLLSSSRDYIKISIDGRIKTVFGEPIFPDDSNKYYVIYLSETEKWDNGQECTESEHLAIIQDITTILKNNGYDIKIITH